MGSMHQIVGSYNTRKVEGEKAQRRAIEAKKAKAKALKARHDEITNLVCLTFKDCKPWNRRSKDEIITAQAIGAELADLGGEDYAEAIDVLRWAFDSKERYADALACFITARD